MNQCVYPPRQVSAHYPKQLPICSRYSLRCTNQKKPYNSQRHGVKWYRKLAELFVETTEYDIVLLTTEYNSFTVCRMLNPNTTTTHLLFRQNLIEEFVQFHLFGSRNSQTGPNATSVNNNPLRLIERHFI